MARIEEFDEGQLERMSLHDPIRANLYCYEFGGRKLLQINTTGRSSREMPGKVSQSIQFDEKAARQLYDAMKDHFGFK